MYFVVYILENSAFAIIPQNWIRDFSQHHEKFLNNGINSSQVFICYWNEQKEARNANLEPNFNLPLGEEFPSTGNYLCKLIKAKSDYNEARKVLLRKRVAPAIYNPMRLCEMPIPIISPSQSSPALIEGINFLYYLENL